MAYFRIGPSGGTLLNAHEYGTCGTKGTLVKNTAVNILPSGTNIVNALINVDGINTLYFTTNNAFTWNNIAYMCIENNYYTSSFTASGATCTCDVSGLSGLVSFYTAFNHVPQYVRVSWTN